MNHNTDHTSKHEPATEPVGSLALSEGLGPLEALRFFCSQHLPAQAWLDSEPLFAAVAADVGAEREQWRDLLRECEQSLSDMTGPYWPARVEVLRLVQAALRA